MDTSQFQVSNPDSYVLADTPTAAPSDFDREESKRRVKQLTKQIQALQEKMWAEGSIDFW